MELTPRGIFEELNRLPWGRFTDKQRKAALTKFAGALYAEMRRAGVRAPGSVMTATERREELVSFFDEKLRARELTAAEVREMVSLCGLDHRSQDIHLEVVDFRGVDWLEQREMDEEGLEVPKSGSGDEITDVLEEYEPDTTATS